MSYINGKKNITGTNISKERTLNGTIGEINIKPVRDQYLANSFYGTTFVKKT